MMKKIFFLLPLLWWSCAHKFDKADLIVHNAHIHIMDADRTIAEAMAIKDGKVLEFGPERHIMNKYRADEDFDAQQQHVYPGFIDAHGHLLGYGQSLINVNLLDTKSWEDVLQALKTYSEKEKHDIIVGRGWDQSDWENKSFPENSALNTMFPDIPVVLYRIDGHAAIVNNKALEMAGIKDTDTIQGGEFMRENGVLTGVLIDNAIVKVVAQLPMDTPEKKEKALLKAGESLVQYGITSVSDAGVDQPEIDLFKKLQKENRFPLRVYAMMIPTKSNLAKYAEEGIYKDDFLHIRSFKFVADGAMGSWGACMKHPYLDAPGAAHYGAMVTDVNTLKDAASLLDEIGFQMNTHCIGDSANKVVLAIYAEFLKDMNDKRWRIEHAQILDTADFSYFGKYSIVPSVQPTHATSDRHWVESRIGKARMKGAYAYKTLLKQNGWIALGTDFPVEDPNPIYTFYAAVFRKDKNGNPKEGFLPEEALTREEALKGMTTWAAKSNFEEHEKGMLSPGKFADFVILSQDILTVPEEQILKTFVQSTWIAGKKVYAL